ncbi:centromere protein X-like [Dermacentor albipictus]|uniref:centromere protein X-like n=1 Tax=Dermacentor albipictus TaxID=60249 RepID=UPI0038FC4E29
MEKMAAKAGASKQTSKEPVGDDHVEVLDDNAEMDSDPLIPRTTTFKVKTIQELMKLNFEDDKTRISADALKLLAEFFRVFTMEAVERATEQAKVQCDNVVTTEHVEKILPQLMLDFP